MTSTPDAMPHGPIEEIFPDVFFLTGTMKNEFFGSMWQFSRNMIVVREAGKLSLINAIRLDEAGLKELESLGTIANVVRIGSLHGYDDRFYIEKYGAKYWAMKSTPDDKQLKVDHWMEEGSELPFSDASLFVFKETKLPEGIIRLDRDGGIMIACDALQNYTDRDEYFDDDTVEKMRGMGFFKEANCGVAWMHMTEPKPGDFVRLKELEFEHVLCGHGKPFVGGAKAPYHATFKQLFEV